MKIPGIFFGLALLFSSSLEAQDYRIENNEVKITKAVMFKTASAELLPESDEALLIIKKYLDDKSYISLLRIEGHTDNGGNVGDNQLLSEKRALAVCKRLISLGADCKRCLLWDLATQNPLLITAHLKAKLKTGESALSMLR